jgi:hypothetical protein
MQYTPKWQKSRTDMIFPGHLSTAVLKVPLSRSGTVCAVIWQLLKMLQHLPHIRQASKSKVMETLSHPVIQIPRIHGVNARHASIGRPFLESLMA